MKATSKRRLIAHTRVTWQVVALPSDQTPTLRFPELRHRISGLVSLWSRLSSRFSDGVSDFVRARCSCERCTPPRLPVAMISKRDHAPSYRGSTDCVLTEAHRSLGLAQTNESSGRGPAGAGLWPVSVVQLRGNCSCGSISGVVGSDDGAAINAMSLHGSTRSTKGHRPWHSTRQASARHVSRPSLILLNRQDGGLRRRGRGRIANSAGHQYLFSIFTCAVIQRTRLARPTDC